MFVIGPDKRIKLSLAYPMTTGRYFDEVLRAIDSMQLTAAHRVATPANRRQGDDVVIAGSVSDDEARTPRVALTYRGRISRASRPRSRTGRAPIPPGLVADQAVTASVLGVRRLPLASQGLAADAGTGRADDALGDPPHLDQTRLITIFDTPHDDLPIGPSPRVVVAADRGGRDDRPNSL